MLTAIEFLEGKNRMCQKQKCIDCELSCDNNGTNLLCQEFIKTYPEKAIGIVEEWLKENPLKTNKDKFNEIFKKDKGGRWSSCKTTCCNELPCSFCGWWDEEYKGE